MTTVVERIADTLEGRITEAFGLMGNGNAFLIDALERRTSIVYTAVRHEVATVASADAYARVARRPALATATYGAGFTNTITALADARMQRTPMLVIAGDAPTTGARPWDVDQVALAAAVGVPTVVVAREAPGRSTLEALELAIRERTPVVLALPYDLPTAEAGDEALPAPSAGEFAAPVVEPAAADVAEVARLLASAERPVVLAGRGAVDARAELAALADRLGALTVSSAPARGMFAGRALDLGVAGGFSSERTLGYVRRADVILVVGASLNQFTSAFGSLYGDAHVIQIDVANAATNPRVDFFVRASALAAVETIAAALDATMADAGAQVPAQTWPGVDPADVSGAQFDRDLGLGTAPDGRLDPRSLAGALDRILPEDRVIAHDGGHFIGWSSTHLRVPAPDSIVLVGTAFQSIGLGFSSAMGAHRARPESLLVVSTGDGGGLMALADLESVVRTSKRAVVVVYNDAAYNAEVQQYGSQGIGTGPMMIPEVDFAAVAKGVGAESLVVRSLDDLAAFERWIESDAEGTFVLDCRISREIVNDYQLEILVNGFGLDPVELGVVPPAGERDPRGVAAADAVPAARR